MLAIGTNFSPGTSNPKPQNLLLSRSSQILLLPNPFSHSSVTRLNASFPKHSPLPGPPTLWASRFPRRWLQLSPRAHPQTQPSPLYSHSGTELLGLGTTDVRGQVVLGGGAELYTTGCLAGSPASTSRCQDQLPPFNYKCFQMSPNVPCKKGKVTVS